jgi:hypothetical protein
MDVMGKEVVLYCCIVSCLRRYQSMQVCFPWSAYTVNMPVSFRLYMSGGQSMEHTVFVCFQDANLWELMLRIIILRSLSSVKML